MLLSLMFHYSVHKNAKHFIFSIEINQLKVCTLHKLKRKENQYRIYITTIISCDCTVPDSLKASFLKLLKLFNSIVIKKDMIFIS